MRHFLVIGPQGENVGMLVEIGQLFGDRKSAFDAQDFLSNKLGKDFYRSYYLKYKNMLTLEQIVEKFFKDREKQRKLQKQ